MPAPQELDDGSFGAFVRARREAFGWEQLELAVRAEMEQATISRIETGRTNPRNLALASLERLAVALRVPVAALLATAGIGDGPPAPVSEVYPSVLEELLARPGSRERLLRAGQDPVRVAAAIDAVLQVIVPTS